MGLFFRKKTAPLEVSVTTLPFDLRLVGRSKVTTENGLFLDAPLISERYVKVDRLLQHKLDPFCRAAVIFQKDSEGKFRYYLGTCVSRFSAEETPIEKAEELFIPAKTLCAKMTVQAPSASAWSVSLGQARQLFYEDWLPKSDYICDETLESIELYGLLSLNSSPVMDLYFPLRRIEEKEKIG